MGMWDRFGRGSDAQLPVAQPMTDEQAIARYRYLLRTAPPEAIEEAHAEAFAQLTPEQRRRVLEELRQEMPEAERIGAARAGDSPDALARLATRAEIRQPGAMERIFGGLPRGQAWQGAGPGVGGGLGGMLAGTFFASMAGTVLGSMVAQQFFGGHPEASQLFGGDSQAGGGDASRFEDLSKGVESFGDRHANGATDASADSFGDGGIFDGGDTFDV